MNTVLLVGVAGLAVYFLTRPKTVSPYTMPAVTATAGGVVSAYNPYAQVYAGATPQGNTTGGIIAASGTAASSLISSLGDIFSG